MDFKLTLNNIAILTAGCMLLHYHPNHNGHLHYLAVNIHPQQII